METRRVYGIAEDVLSQEEEVKQKNKQYIFSKKGLAGILAICISVSGAFGAGGAILADSLSTDGSSQVIPNESIGLKGTGTTLEDATGSKLSVQQIIDLTANAVVEIRTEQVANDSWVMQYVTEGAGSGVIISQDGYIMTNNHVIEGASKITVTLRDDTEYEATLVGTDSQTDVAVIKIQAENLTSASFGDSDKINIGDLAVAIGNPLGQLGGTATAGIISSLDRQLTIDGKAMSLLQTDASINPGNSGGGLFDQYGTLIGLVVAKSSGSDIEGLGFAIPVNTAKTVALQIIDHGYVKGRPSMGLTLIDLTSMQNAIQYGVRNLGLYVKSAESEGAKNAGFQEGDLLYIIEDTQIASMNDVQTALAKHEVGDTIKVTVVRANETVDLSVVLGEKGKDQ